MPETEMLSLEIEEGSHSLSVKMESLVSTISVSDIRPAVLEQLLKVLIQVSL